MTLLLSWFYARRNRFHTGYLQWTLKSACPCHIVRYLCSLPQKHPINHFYAVAEHVAPVMVVLDHVANGYRDIILPLACDHDLLRRAVGVVAAQHFALSHPDYQGAVDQGRAAIISQLRQDAFQASPDHVFNQGTWATIIVLLVGETITGSSEYGHLLQTLLCLFQNVGHINSSTKRFLTQQTHMYVDWNPCKKSVANVLIQV